MVVCVCACLCDDKCFCRRRMRRLRSSVCVHTQSSFPAQCKSGKLQEASNCAQRNPDFGVETRHWLRIRQPCLGVLYNGTDKMSEKGPPNTLEIEAAEGEEIDRHIKDIWVVHSCSALFVPNIMHHKLKCFDLPWPCGRLQSAGIRRP